MDPSRAPEFTIKEYLKQPRSLPNGLHEGESRMVAGSYGLPLYGSVRDRIEVVQTVEESTGAAEEPVKSRV